MTHEVFPLKHLQSTIIKMFFNLTLSESKSQPTKQRSSA